MVELQGNQLMLGVSGESVDGAKDGMIFDVIEW